MKDAKIEKQIVTGMIVSTEFCQGLAPIYREQLQLPSTNKVASWCMDYFREYGQAPKKHIKDIFKHHSKALKEEHRFLIEEFLERLSSKYKSSKTFNVQYVLDIAEEYLRTIAVEEVQHKLSQAIEKGAVTRAENIIKKFERTARPESKGADPFSKDAVVKAFTKDTGNMMYSYPGELGRIVGPFERECLSAFFGVRGTGKTWWLLWSGLLGVFAGYNVVFVSLEMSEEQIFKRIHQYLNARPTRRGAFKLPVFNDKSDGIKTKLLKRNRKQLDIGSALSKLSDIDESSLVKANFKLLTYPSGTLTMDDLRAQLHNMEYYEDFIPDMVITDMADKFKSTENGDYRHKIGSVWRQHKALAQEKKCHVLTCSHTNTARTGKDAGVGSAAESMEKENESDVIYALNQHPEQKLRGLMRILLTKHRHDDYDLLREVYVTQCLSIGRPYLDSRLKPRKKKGAKVEQD